jgi:hypothetical protein
MSDTIWRTVTLTDNKSGSPPPPQKKYVIFNFVLWVVKIWVRRDLCVCSDISATLVTDTKLSTATDSVQLCHVWSGNTHGLYAYKTMTMRKGYFSFSSITIWIGGDRHMKIHTRTHAHTHKHTHIHTLMLLKHENMWLYSTDLTF